MATLKLFNTYVQSSYSIVGKFEKEGPLGIYFDKDVKDIYAGQETFEKGEIEVLKQTIQGAIDKSKLKLYEIEIAFGGDLTNQIAVSNYVMQNFPMSFIGVYGACSTSMLSLALAALYVEKNNYKNAIAFASSHNQTAEKQFRFPNEYGVQKSPNATFTVTGSSAIIVGRKQTSIRISSVTLGRVVDSKLDDSSDLGSAMALAALDTLKKHLFATNTRANDYDLIVTGDLSAVGSKVLKQMARYEGIELTKYNDCGLMIYNRHKQDVYAGGSGCACCGVVTAGYLLKLLERGIYKKILVIGTGALFSPMTFQQTQTIPSIAHCVCLEGC